MFKSYNFWIRLVAVLVLLLRIVGSELGFSVDSALIIDLATAIASVLVVLGVIQVPVQKVESSIVNGSEVKNKNGGEFMKTFEQIKEDLLTVKEKIETSVAKENSVVGEISAIIDAIIGEQTEEQIETSVESVEGGETKIEEESREEEQILDVAPQVEGEVDEVCIAEENIITDLAEESQVERVVIEKYDDEKNAEAVSENEVLTEKLVEDAVFTVNEFITEEEKAKIDSEKLNEILREKIAQLLSNEIDNILESASV